MTVTATASLHASCIAIGEDGILLRGPSGCGKSDLALRLIDGGAALVADDVVDIACGDDGVLRAAPPAALAGLLEVRGIGPLRLPHRTGIGLRLVADLVPAGPVERVPLPAFATILGRDLPLLRLDPWLVSAPARLRMALACRDQLDSAHRVRAAAE